MTYLREQGALKSRSTFSFLFPRLSAVAAMVLILCVGVSSYAYASDAVLPNTPLYPVRAALEQVEIKLAVTPVQKEKVVQKLVERRKKEVEKLTELKRPVPVKLKQYVRGAATTTTERVLKQKIDEKKAERGQVKQDLRAKAIEKLQAHLRDRKEQRRAAQRKREEQQQERQRILRERQEAARKQQLEQKKPRSTQERQKMK